MHYQRLKKTGSFDQPLMTAPDEIRFWSKVDKTGACWLWRGGIGGEGYGYVWWNGRQQRAHRIAYELLVSRIPASLTIDHLRDLCNNRACVKAIDDETGPAHLEVVTLAENIRRIHMTPELIQKRREAGRKGAAARWRMSRVKQPE